MLDRMLTVGPNEPCGLDELYFIIYHSHHNQMKLNDFLNIFRNLCVDTALIINKHLLFSHSYSNFSFSKCISVSLFKSAFYDVTKILLGSEQICIGHSEVGIIIVQSSLISTKYRAEIFSTANVNTFVIRFRLGF